MLQRVASTIFHRGLGESVHAVAQTGWFHYCLSCLSHVSIMFLLIMLVQIFTDRKHPPQ